MTILRPGKRVRRENIWKGYAWTPTYHFKTNDATTNHDQLLGHLRQGNCACTCNDLLFVDLETRKGCCLATSGDNNIFGLDVCLAPVQKVDSNRMFVYKRTRPLDIVNLVLLEEEFHALRQSGHGFIFRLHHLREVEFDVADINASLFGVV